MGILLLTFHGLYGQDAAISSIQDDSALRISLKDAWFTEEPAVVIGKRPHTTRLPGGGMVQVQAGRRNNELFVYLARERNGTYPGWAQGSWIYTRYFNTGFPVRLRLFLRSDPQMYVQWRPLGTDRSQIDVVIYDAYMVRGLPLGLSFERLLTMPLEEILGTLGSRFPRRYFEPNTSLYRNIGPSRANPDNNFIARVRKSLSGLSYVDDGAFDENGRYVFINNLEPQANNPGLNCSGFVKWVVDGMLRPVTGTRLAIEPLKAPVTPRTASLAANFEDREYLFGLDWTRNLALSAAGVLRSPAFAILENVEVRKDAFAALIDREGGSAAVINYPGFLLNAGFSIEGLRPLLYALAVDEPGFLYLASVNRERGRAPSPRQHYHVAAIIPYFNEFGVFQTAVFESAAETNLAGFISRHPGAQINLVRIPIEGSFSP